MSQVTSPSSSNLQLFDSFVINDTSSGDRYEFKVDRGEFGVCRIVVDITAPVAPNAFSSGNANLASRLFGTPPGQVQKTTETFNKIRLVYNEGTSREITKNLEELASHDINLMCNKLASLHRIFERLQEMGQLPTMKKMNDRLLVKF